MYVPLDRGGAQDALIELSTLGVEIYPGASARTRNTRLSVIARRALEPVIGEEGAAAVEKQVADGKLTLAELDRLAEQGRGSRQARFRSSSAPRIPPTWRSPSWPARSTTRRLGLPGHGDPELLQSLDDPFVERVGGNAPRARYVYRQR